MLYMMPSHHLLKRNLFDEVLTINKMRACELFNISHKIRKEKEKTMAQMMIKYLRYQTKRKTILTKATKHTYCISVGCGTAGAFTITAPDHAVIYILFYKYKYVQDEHFSCKFTVIVFNKRHSNEKNQHCENGDVFIK